MYRSHEKNADGSHYLSNFKTINGIKVNVGNHKPRHQEHHVTAHLLEPQFKASDGLGEKDIVRFYNKNRNPRVMQRGVSQRKAYLHTNDPSTRKDGVYFDASEKTGKYD